MELAARVPPADGVVPFRRLVVALARLLPDRLPAERDLVLANDLVALKQLELALRLEDEDAFGALGSRRARRSECRQSYQSQQEASHGRRIARASGKSKAAAEGGRGTKRKRPRSRAAA